MKQQEGTANLRIAVMGGTFDPIHYGHLVAAEAVYSEFGARSVIFIPTGAPPHKKTRVTCAEARYEMTALAVASNPHFSVSRMEIDRSGETYTIDTVRQLRGVYPDAEIFFITGADAVHQILTWHNAAELLKLCSFVAVTRPGYDPRKLKRQVEHLKGRFLSRLHFLEVPALAISSSDIRGRRCAGKPISYLLPEPVEGYIERGRLYQNDDLKAAVKAKLSDYRYRHTLGVHDAALELARIHGASCEKAAIAALLHDYAKEIPDGEKLALCEKFGVKTDRVMRASPDLTHSFLSAELARAEFGINDSETLNAIAYHTTGRKKMGLLEKVLFVADISEPNRESYEGLDGIRRLAREDLDAAAAESLRRKLEYTREKGGEIHPISAGALDYLTKRIKTADIKNA